MRLILLLLILCAGTIELAAYAAQPGEILGCDPQHPKYAECQKQLARQNQPAPAAPAPRVSQCYSLPVGQQRTQCLADESYAKLTPEQKLRNDELKKVLQDGVPKVWLPTRPDKK